MNRKPPSQDLFIRPAVDLFGEEAEQQVQVVIQHGETGHLHGEDLA